MELRSGHVKIPAPAKSIHEIIPNEIMDKILRMLPIEDLLQCRSVSKLWKSFSSAICRGRYVTADLTHVFTYALESEEFYEIFKQSSDLLDLPWSACSLEFLNHPRPQLDFTTILGENVLENFINRKQLKRFTGNFGSHVRKLRLEGDNLDLVKIALKEMPNLEVLISEIEPTVEDIGSTLSGDRFDLNTLKRLEIFVRNVGQVKFLEFLLESAPNLEKILVEFLGNYDPLAKELQRAELSRMATLISSIPRIGFHFWRSGTAELFQSLNSPGLNIKKLQIDPFSDEAVFDDGWIRGLEQILAGNSNSLEKLEMGCDCPDGSRLVSRLQLPVFSKLKKLELTWNFVSSENPTFLQRFTASHFPILTKLGINISGTENNDQLATVFGSKPFELVRNLAVCNELNPTILDIKTLFPNVLTLEVYGVTRGSHSIYQGMTNLEKLYLQIANIFEGESMAIIYAYPKNREGTAQTPSLSSLTNLKSLSLNFGYKKEEDFPSEVHLALLNLQRLDDLTFQGIEISEDVKQKLSAYHRNVDVQN